MSGSITDIKSIFGCALDIPSAAERSAYLDEACAGDLQLRAELESLLQARQAAGQFLSARQPIADTADLGVEKHISSESIGTMINPYKLIEQIGEGGFGVVYLAEQTEPVRRKVALKILKPGMDTKQIVARFEAERQALAIMDHPNIAKVFDGGSTGLEAEAQRGGTHGTPRCASASSGRPYFVMELVKGVPITEYCDQNHLTPRQRLELFIPVCQAVQHAHQKGIIHRDLKPSNVLVTRYDSTPVPKIIDFGVAKALGQELTDKTLLTGIAQMVGTPLYMSPEQAGMCNLDVDTRSDIYSLGVLLYELLTGTTPFDKERFKKAAYDEIRHIIREEEPPKPSTRISQLNDPHAARETPNARRESSTISLASVSALRQTEPAKLSRLVKGELDWIVMKCLEKDRNRRYETANSLAMDLQRYLADEPVEAVPPSAGYRLRKFARRNKRALLGATLLGLMLLALVGGLGWVMSDRAERQARTAFVVNQFLQQAELKYADNKIPEAAAEVQKARGVLEGGHGGDELGRRVRQWLIDLDTAAKLEEIRMESSHFAARDSVYAEYARVFRDYGIDVEVLSIEAAAARIAGSQIKLDLVLALDRWAASLRSDARKLDPATWRRKLAISQTADPDQWRQHYNEACEAKDVNALRKIADKADLNRLRTRTLAALGDSLRVMDDVKASVAFLRKAQQQHPDDSSINSSLAWGLRSLDPPQWNEAIAFRRIVVALRPNSPIARLNLGSSLHSQGKLDEASVCYRKAIELDSTSAAAYYDLGIILRAQGKAEEAMANFKKSVDLLPDDPNPLNALAWELATCAESELRDPARAVALAKKVVELSLKQGDDRDRAGQYRLGNYWNTLGVAHYRAGDPENALAALKTSLDISNEGTSHYIGEDCFFLAMANWKLDKKGEAREWYDRAVAWINDNELKDDELIQLRAEASKLLGIANNDEAETAPHPRVKQ